MQAVIFDLDGTLVDLFEHHFRAFKQLMQQEFSIDFPREYLSERYGRSAGSIIKSFLDDNNIKRDIDINALINERQVYFKKNVYSNGVAKILPGAIELLDRLKKSGFKLALATSNTRANAEAILEATDLTHKFDLIISREDVDNGKPDPDIFKVCAERLGVQARDCTVVEDSIYGIQAGKRAAMTTIAVVTGQHDKAQLLSENPDLVVDNLSDISFVDIKA